MSLHYNINITSLSFQSYTVCFTWALILLYFYSPSTKKYSSHIEDAMLNKWMNEWVNEYQSKCFKSLQKKEFNMFGVIRNCYIKIYVNKMFVHNILNAQIKLGIFRSMKNHYSTHSNFRLSQNTIIHSLIWCLYVVGRTLDSNSFTFLGLEQ